MDPEELSFGSIKAPGISKKSGKIRGQNSKVEAIMRRLAVLTNSIQQNSQNLDTLNYDLTLAEHFKDSVNEKFVKSTEMVNIKQSMLNEIQTKLSEEEGVADSLENLYQRYHDQDKTIDEHESNISNLYRSKECFENDENFLKENIIRLIIEEDNVRKSIDHLRVQTTSNLINQNSLLKQRGDDKINDIQEKIRSLQTQKNTRREPQFTVVYKNEYYQLFVVLGVLAFLIFLKYYYF